MKTFKINALPKDVRDMVESIEWQDGTLDEDLMGIAYLKDGYCLFDDNSHTLGFTSRSDLVEVLRTCVERE